MQFVSTRGRAPAVSFSDAILNGLAPDGGLYMPEAWPSVDAASIERFATAPYDAVAAQVIEGFFDAGEFSADIAEITAEAYGTFRHPAVVPLVEIGPHHYILELFHGPTLSFKDVA